AGIANMSLAPFIAMTLSGAFLWDLILAAIGWKFREHARTLIHDYQKPVDVVVIAIFGGGAIYLIAKMRARVRSRKSPPADLDAPKVGP
ncbi:MAG: DedA family protein, partial [Planctomycetota bacterium]